MSAHEFTGLMPIARVSKSMPIAVRPRGRPRDPEKRLALIAAARAVFLDNGADGVTVDHVIAGAGVSRATFYSNFVDRHDLLAAVIGQESQRIVTDDGAQACSARDVRTALLLFGDGFLHFLADPDTMRLEPLILHVRQNQPELAASFFLAGPRRVWDILASIIRTGQERGEIASFVDPEAAVSDLIGLWRGSWYVEVMYGRRTAPEGDELRRICRHSVDLFLRACGTESRQERLGTN